MFGRLAIESRVVKKSKDDTPTVEVTHLDPEQIAQIAKEFVTYVAVTTVGVVATTTILKTVCKIAVITAKAKIR